MQSIKYILGFNPLHVDVEKIVMTSLLESIVLCIVVNVMCIVICV
jgi:hypothetical protein